MCVKKKWQMIFDRELRSGLTINFILLLLRHESPQFLILDKKTGRSYRGKNPRKVLSCKRKPKSPIRNMEKFNASPKSGQCLPNFPNVFPNVHNIYQLSRMSAKCPQFLPYDLINVPQLLPNVVCSQISDFFQNVFK